MAAVLALAALVRIVVAVAGADSALVHDSTVYLKMADAIVGEAPVASFPNGYPLLIALFRTFCDSERIVSVLLGLNVLFGVLAVWMTVRIGWIVFRGNPVPSFLAGAALALYPHQLRYTQLVMSEIPGMFFLLAAFWCWFEAEAPERLDLGEGVAWRFGAGLALHASFAIRPSFLLVAPFFAAILLIPRAKVPTLLPAVGGFALGAALLFGLERIGVVRAPVAPDNNLLIAISSNSRATEFTLFPPEMQARAKSLYLDFARTHPMEFLRQRLESLWELWGPKSLPGYRLEQESLVVKAIIALRTVLVGGSLVALWIRRHDASLRLLMAPVAAVTVVHTATFSNHRFTAPLEPFLFLLCASLVAGRAIGSPKTPPVQ